MTDQAVTAQAATILVVDDQASNRELVRHTLVEEGHNVLVAASGAEAFALWERGPPDCVLLDIRMPDLDGFAVCERLRKLPGGAETPILFLTAVRDVDAFEQALTSGAVDFLTKPIKPAELIIRVQTALKLHRLSSERDELYALLRQQRDSLQRAALQNEQLSAFLVHDLKNPVGGMRLATHRLLADPEISPRTREVAERIRQEADTLLRMIVDLLDIARGDERGLAVTRNDVQLKALVAEVFSALVLRAKTREVALQSSFATTELHADRELVRRLLENLVDNAIRHAPRGSAVTVAAAREDGGLLLRVADVGPGVPEDLRQTIFGRFVQAHPRGTRIGRGLGLAFCKLVAEAHEGRIWVEDGAPGAVFCVWLPDQSERRG
jgi:two-component system, sensor histidine kinase and response regulator